MTTKFKHNNYCDCFECTSPDAPFIGDNADVLQQINDYLGFGVKAGDWIEITKVVNIYDPKGTAKTIVPPLHLQVNHVTPTFVYMDGVVTKDGLADQYKGWYIYANTETFIVIPKGIAKTLQKADQGVQAVKDFGVSIGDKLSDLFGGIKWLIIGVLVLLVIALVLRVSGK